MSRDRTLRDDAADTDTADTADTVRLDPRSLRGLAHPVRLRLLGLLRTDGPSTATRLGERLGLSSAATSYHLRQLAQHGFIAEDEGRGQPRERWWKAVHRVTLFDRTLGEDDPEVAAVGSAYLRTVARAYADKVDAYLDESDRLPAPWRSAGTLSDLLLRLTPQETEDLTARLWSIVEEQRLGDVPATDAPEGSRRVVVQLQVFPHPGDEE